MNCVQECLYTGFPSWQTIDVSVCNGLINTEPGKLIGTKLSFQMNHASICGTMMAVCVFDTMPVNAAFQSALMNDIVAKHPELWSRVRFCNMTHPICYKLRVISIATSMSVKCYSLKLFPSFCNLKSEKGWQVVGSPEAANQ